jgi:hypothetical protein
MPFPVTFPVCFPFRRVPEKNLAGGTGNVPVSSFPFPISPVPISNTPIPKRNTLSPTSRSSARTLTNANATLPRSTRFPTPSRNDGTDLQLPQERKLARATGNGAVRCTSHSRDGVHNSNGALRRCQRSETMLPGCPSGPSDSAESPTRSGSTAPTEHPLAMPPAAGSRLVSECPGSAEGRKVRPPP